MKMSSIAKENILAAIGNTPIVSLEKIAPHLTVNLYGKCEFLNPGGSIKDRIGLHIINEAEKQGLIKKGGTIIEATSGNTGVGLALVAAIRGYKCIFVMADKQSQEKRTALSALGAKVVVCPTDVEPDDERSYYKVAEKLVRETPNCFYASQYQNQDNPKAHYLTTGPEIYEQCGNDLDFLVAGIGTGGTISGIAKYIKERNPKFQTVAVDPVGSMFYDYFYNKKMIKATSYLIEGIGEDFIPKTIDMNMIDHMVRVNDEESLKMARALLKTQGLLVGGSTGAAVVGAIKYFEQNPQEKINGRKPNALVILVDSSSRYLSKYLRDEWMIEKGFSL